MTDFVVQKEQIKVILSKNESYLVEVPSISQSKKFSKIIAESDVKDVMDKVQEFLVELGLPMKIQEEHLSAKALLSLWETVNGKKK